MNGSVVAQLIRKDWHLHRVHISLTLAGGAAALVVSQFTSETAAQLAGVWLFVVLCILGSMLPFSMVVNERKRQNLPFIMSLPISPAQYTTSKIVSAVSMFLAPWLTLLVAALVLIEIRGVVPHGAIPMLLVLALLPFVVFCLILATALVSESEGWVIATNVVCSSSYWFVWYLLSRVPELSANSKGQVADWNPIVFFILSSEIALIAMFVALTFFLQSRKRDFVH